MQQPGAVRSLLTFGLLSLLFACGGGGTPDSLFIPPIPPAMLQADRVFDQLSFNSPVAQAQAPGDDTQWFAVEQSGVIRVFDNDPTVSVSTVFVDISGRVDSGPSEAGLLGIAFDPAYPVVDDQGLSTLSSSTNQTTIPSSRKVAEYCMTTIDRP